MNVATVLSERMHDYYVAREAEEVQLEALAGTRSRGEDVDATHFYRQTGAADLGGKEPLTLKVWMQQTTPPQPSPTELQDAAVYSAADALDRLNELTRERDAVAALIDYEVACLVELGMTVTEIGRRLGMSKQRISQRLAAHRSRAHG